jgi:ribosomal protein S18 acetylase RimI-like enzyme
MEMADVPRAAEIHVFGWRSAYRGIVSDEWLFNNRLVAFSMNRMDLGLRNGSETENYVFDDGIIKAILSVSPCRDEDRPHSFELCGIYVEPFFQGYGIGSMLVEYCDKLAVERGYKEISLWAYEGNYRARMFYEKRGYTYESTLFPEHWHAAGVRYVKGV